MRWQACRLSGSTDIPVRDSAWHTDCSRTSGERDRDRERQKQRQTQRENKKAEAISSFDFNFLYTNLPHQISFEFYINSFDGGGKKDR